MNCPICGNADISGVCGSCGFVAVEYGADCVDCGFGICACILLEDGYSRAEAAAIVAFFQANPNADNEVITE